jgi:hypothetical protein
MVWSPRILKPPTFGRSTTNLPKTRLVQGQLSAPLDLPTVERLKVHFSVEPTPEKDMIAFQVNDMTCGHCVSTIAKAVRAVDKDAKIQIDLTSHRVDIARRKPTLAS